jgi:hypothetical protein
MIISNKPDMIKPCPNFCLRAKRKGHKATIQGSGLDGARLSSWVGRVYVLALELKDDMEVPRGKLEDGRLADR